MEVSVTVFFTVSFFPLALPSLRTCCLLSSESTQAWGRQVKRLTGACGVDECCGCPMLEDLTQKWDQGGLPEGGDI